MTHPEPLSSRDEVTQIVAANARHAAAPPLELAADMIAAMADEIAALAAKLPAAGEP